MPTKVEKDSVTGRDTTGHQWDGLKELNTPLPKWWLYVLYACIAFAIVWVIDLPGHPDDRRARPVRLDGARRHRAGAGSRARCRTSRCWRSCGRATPAQIAADPALRAYALAGGRIAFANNCAACHGSGGQGAVGGFPSLADDDWLYGGSFEAIHGTIAHGVRNGVDDEARGIAMPRFLADGLLTAPQVNDVTEHLLALHRPCHRCGGGGSRRGGLRRELRQLPRREGRGQPRHGRAAAERPGLALWRRQGEHPAQRRLCPRRRDAELVHQARPGDRQHADRLRPRFGRRRVSEGIMGEVKSPDRTKPGAAPATRRRSTPTRQKVYPKAVKGPVRRAKWLILALCLGSITRSRCALGPRAGHAGPGGAGRHRQWPAVLLLIEIWPQEVYYLTGLLVLAADRALRATSLFGRVWCGFACPQTVWTDLFMWVERLIQGDRNARMKLDLQPWSPLAAQEGRQPCHLAGHRHGHRRRLDHVLQRRAGDDAALLHRPGQPRGLFLLRPVHRHHLPAGRLGARAGLHLHVPLAALPGGDAG